MLKTIPVSQLRIGMYICDTESASLTALIERGILNDNDLLYSLQKNPASMITIDTEQGLDILEPGLFDLKSRIEITKSSKTQRRPIPPPALPEIAPTSLNEELALARPLRKQALELLSHNFHNIKMGRAIHTGEMLDLVKNLTESVLRNHSAILLLGQIRSKSTYLFEHALNTCTLALSFSKWKKLDYDTAISLGMAGLLHDVGETMLDDRLTFNKGHLDDIEYQEMQQHVSYSVKILSDTKGISPLTRTIVGQHHERLDGSGYPSRLSGGQIHPMAQLLGLVDIYDSMTAETTYRYANSPTQVLRQLLESDNQMFDSALIKQFIKCIGIYPVGSLVRMNNGCIAIVNEVNSQNTLQPSVRLIYNARNEHFIKPVDIDLASTNNNSDMKLTITGSVDPNYLHIDLAAFI